MFLFELVLSRVLSMLETMCIYDDIRDGSICLCVSIGYSQHVVRCGILALYGRWIINWVCVLNGHCLINWG